MKRPKFDIDKALDTIDMEFSGYTPSNDALEFFNLIRVFFGEDFEIPNPLFHYFIVDMLYGKVKPEDFPYSDEVIDTITINPEQIGIIATRGSAKSTVTTLFYPIVACIKGTLPVTGPLSHILILSDSQQGGARDQSLLIGNAFKKSVFANEWFESIRSTESELEVVRKGEGSIEKRHMLIKFKGAQALSLDSTVYTDQGPSCIGHCKVGDEIFGPDGKLCTITEKSEIFHRPMYKITLADGRELKVSDDHINSILFKHNNYVNGTPYEHLDITTKDLLQLPRWFVNKKTGYKTPRLWIENTAPVEYSEKELPIDPYTLGLLLGDGHYHSSDYSLKLTGKREDLEYYHTQIPYEVGCIDQSKDSEVDTVTIKGLSKAYQHLGLHGTKASTKFIPDIYKIGSIEQRLSLLQGLIDTDGSIAKGKRGSRFMTTSAKLAEDVMELVRSLGGTASCGISHKAGEGSQFNRNHDLFRVNIHLNMPTARLPRKVAKLVPNVDSGKVAIIDIESIEMEESQCIRVDNESHQFLTSNYTRTHNTGGIRSGSRNPVTGDRYALIIADDVIKNEAEAHSETIMKNVTTALTSDATNAMRAKNRQFVIINTPFHKRDPIYMMVESGGFTPLVAPICKSIDGDLKKEEFEGLWPDMHSYESVMSRYLNAVSTNSTRSFYQELMLRVSNEEDKLVPEELIQWYDRKMLMKLLDGYSLYITTDFTTTSKAKSDFSAIALWAVSSNYDYFLLDLCVRRQEIDQQYNELFRMISVWSKGGRAIDVGVEVDGQQKAHLFGLKQKMQMTNRYFSFARQKGASPNKEGISSGSSGSKHERFRYVVPHFQNRKIYFPEELRETEDMKEALKQLNGVTTTGFSYHDDFCDVVSQLGLIDIIPGTGSDEASFQSSVVHDGEIWTGVWDDDEEDNYNGSTIF